MRILIWNAQHLDNQGLFASIAYKEKVDFLDSYLLSLGDDIDIIVLLETGKTGNVNNSLNAFFDSRRSSYTLISHLDQEGGLAKFTTLGINIYCKTESVNDYRIGSYILVDKERRAALPIIHGTEMLAFYHANAVARRMSLL